MFIATYKSRFYFNRMYNNVNERSKHKMDRNA